MSATLSATVTRAVVIALALAVVAAAVPTLDRSAASGAPPTRFLLDQPAGELTAAADMLADAEQAGASVRTLRIGAEDTVVVDAGDDTALAADLIDDLARQGVGVQADRQGVGDRAWADLTPNDPDFNPFYAAALGSPELWAAGTGDGTVVAVLDSGVDPTADLPASRILDGRNFIDVGGPTDVDDVHAGKHGTRSAEVAAGGGNNSIANAGGCWDCEVLPVRVMGASLTAWFSDVAAGITWAVDNGADVVSISISGSATTAALNNAVAYAAAEDVAVVSSAGNTGLDEQRYPAALPEVVAVAGLIGPDFDTLHPSSTRGSHVDVATSFCKVLSVSVGGNRTYCGTSSAAPEAAGHIASLVSAGYSPNHVVAAVRASTSSLADGDGQPGTGMSGGGGRLNAAAALAMLEDGSVPPPAAPTPPPEPEPEPEPEPTPAPTVVERLAGPNRFATAAQVSRAAYPAGADTVLVASGLGFPDALAGAGLAGDLDAPTLLIHPGRRDLPSETFAELRRLNPDEVIVLGGPAVVPDVILPRLRTAATADRVVRIAGPDRFATAADIAERVGGGGTAVVVNGRDFPDALAAGPLAAGLGYPVLLTEPDGLPQATRAALGNYDRAVIVGGSAVVSDGVARDIAAVTGTSALRIAGSDRTATAVAVARYLLDTHGWDGEGLVVANGRDFPDALAGAALAAGQQRPLVITDGPGRLGSALPAFVSARSADLSSLTVLGGTAAVPSAQETELARLMRGR